MTSGGEIAPAVLFFVLYAALFAELSFLFLVRRTIRWKSRYLLLYIHIVLRLGGMACGIAFACLSWSSNFTTRLNVLIAYLILSAEGYFSLVVCAYRFLIVWQEDRFGHSWLEPRIPKGTPFRQRFRTSLRAPVATIHWALAAANGIIIAGSSILAGAIDPDKASPSKEHLGKVLRVVGTAIFLTLVQAFLLIAIQSYRRHGDRTLAIILLTWLFLTLRGIYGIITVVMPAFSYYNPDTYTSSGFSATFLAGEYALGTATEWLACLLLTCTHFSKVTGVEGMAEIWESDRRKQEEQPAIGEGDLELKTARNQ